MNRKPHRPLAKQGQRTMGVLKNVLVGFIMALAIGQFKVLELRYEYSMELGPS